MKKLLIVSMIFFYQLRALSPTQPIYISHAGGEIDGMTYTNSKDAFNASIDKGLKYIEVDFLRTSDGHFVLLHEWKSVVNLFGVVEKIYSLEEFKSLKMFNNLESMTLDDLVKWLRQHKDVYIITDTKDDNLLLLTTIQKNYPDVIRQIIPQIYTFNEYEPVKKLGYDHIIYTLYKSLQTNEEIINEVKGIKFFAITMPIERVRSGLSEQLQQFVYCHTINDLTTVNELKQLGVDGFYTDVLY